LGKDKLPPSVLRLINLNAYLCGLGVALRTNEKEARSVRQPYVTEIRKHSLAVRKILSEAEKKDTKPNWVHIREHRDLAKTTRVKMNADSQVQTLKERVRRYKDAIREFGVFGEDGKKLIPTTLAQMGVIVKPVEEPKIPD